MTHRASRHFWRCYHALPDDLRELADKAFALLKIDPRHPSLHFKKVSRCWSARVGLDHRALAFPREDGFLWIWIGRHDEYERIAANVRDGV